MKKTKDKMKKEVKEKSSFKVSGETLLGIKERLQQLSIGKSGISVFINKDFEIILP
jgi:hypothetical protein